MKGNVVTMILSHEYQRASTGGLATGSGNIQTLTTRRKNPQTKILLKKAKANSG